MILASGTAAAVIIIVLSAFKGVANHVAEYLGRSRCELCATSSTSAVRCDIEAGLRQDIASLRRVNTPSVRCRPTVRLMRRTSSLRSASLRS